jgi:AraC-like DNA-binding protein
MQTTLDFTRRQLKIDTSSSPQETEWFHDVFRRDVLKVDLEPVPDATFTFKAAIRALPDLAVSRTYCSPMVSRRRKQATADDALFLALVLDGEARLLHNGLETLMPAGAATYARYDAKDADAAFGMRIGTTILGLRLSRRLIEPLIPNYEELQRHVIPAGAEAARLLVHYLNSLEQHEAIATPEARRLVVSHVYDLAALAVGTSRERAEMAARGLAAARFEAIKADILAELGDGTLGLAAVAERHRASTRYIQMLFERNGITFSEFVLEQRLLRAARLLRDPLHRARKVSDIAHLSGFNDMSYFHRAFRRRFGMTPSDMRSGAG